MFYCQVLFTEVNVIAGNGSPINAHISTNLGPHLLPPPDLLTHLAGSALVLSGTSMPSLAFPSFMPSHGR